jgi:hypothetical protein
MVGESKRMPITFPSTVKRSLEKMSEETGISQGQLVLLATQSMLVNYQNKGSFIFADLLNPEYKGK